MLVFFGGIYTFMICSALKEIHIYNPLLLNRQDLDMMSR